jgi:ParB/RepB/Spo0J family partition protein
MRTVAAKSQYQTIALASIHESTTNPRRTFDESKLTELAESLRTQGLIQPITVRPNSDGYEIIAGARRFRAAQLAAFEEIPVRIVQLSDEQAVEWMLVENSQRLDVHPYEEAQGFQRLLELPGYDAITLAEKTGKSESLIYSRLALLQLIPDVAEAFQAERITASHANLIARLPQDVQQQAFEACWRKDYQDKEAHLLPAKHLSAWIANKVYLPLDEVSFDREDATLNPGACSACPRRSGYNTSLFFDVAGINASTEIATMPSSPSTSTAKWPRDLSWCASRQTTAIRRSGSPARSPAGSTPRLMHRKSRMKTPSRSHRAERQSQPSRSTAKGQAIRAPFARTLNALCIIRAVLSPSTGTPRRDGSSTKRNRPVAGVSKRTAPKHSAASSRMHPTP